MSLLDKLGLTKKSDASDTPVEDEETRWQQEYEASFVDGVYDVEMPLDDKGFYAIHLAQAEMYDLGNIAFIDHYLLYDRGNRICVDVTSDVNPAPLLSRTQTAEVFDDKGVDSIEQMLNGCVKPRYSPKEIEGCSIFRAWTLGEEYTSLRTQMKVVYEAHISLLSAVELFRTEAQILRGKYIEEEK